MSTITESRASALLDDQVHDGYQIAVWWGSTDVAASAAAVAAYPARIEWLDITEVGEADGQVWFVAGGRRFEELPGFPVVLRVKPGVNR